MTCRAVGRGPVQLAVALKFDRSRSFTPAEQLPNGITPINRRQNTAARMAIGCKTVIREVRHVSVMVETFSETVKKPVPATDSQLSNAPMYGKFHPR